MGRNYFEAFGVGGPLESTNLNLSRGLVEFLAAQGVKKIVVCSGSRNAPLIFSLQASGAFDLFHHHDERSAAFFALGLSMPESAPVAVVCTSGTAVAEMLPAAIEAFYQKLPLILVSADRPHEYRGSGAPQAIEQMGIYSHYAKSFDILAEKDFPKSFSYPLHLNLCLAEPKVGDWDTFSVTPQMPAVKSLSKEFPATEVYDYVSTASSLLVVLGSLSLKEAPAVANFLAKLGAPVLADSTANLPPGPHEKLLLRCGEKLLRDWKPEKVLRLGSVPSFRFWRDLESNDIGVMSLSAAGFSGLARASQNFSADLGLLDELELTTQSLPDVFARDAELSEKLEDLLQKFPQSELGFLRQVAKLMAPDALLYLGNSMPIREWNLVNGGHRPTFANRGANGIDGQVSTYLGLADSFAQSWAVVGDQTALYDLNALAIANQKSGRQAIKRRIVVINNGGGKIFSHLNYSNEVEAPQRKILENHHRWEFRAWAEMFGWAYESWQVDISVLDERSDDIILEIFPDPTQTHYFWTEWRSL